MASGNYALGELLDLALGTPEIGAVNFNILHRLLHTILSSLDIAEIRVHVDGSDFQSPLLAGADYRRPAGSPRKPTSPVKSRKFYVVREYLATVAHFWALFVLAAIALRPTKTYTHTHTFTPV